MLMLAFAMVRVLVLWLMLISWVIRRCCEKCELPRDVI